MSAEMAQTDMAAVIRQLNVVTDVVSENFELRRRLEQAMAIIAQQKKLIAELEPEEEPEEETT